MGIARVVPNITAADITATAEFFTGLFGFETVMEKDWMITVASPENPSAQINILRAEPAAAAAEPGTDPSLAPPQITVEADDVDGAYAEANRRGLTIPLDITDEDWGVRRFFVTAPNGVVVNVMHHL